MLAGVDIEKFYQTPVEIYLIKRYIDKEIIEDLRFKLTVNATQLDRSSAKEVNKFNSQMKIYRDLLDPSIPKERKDYSQIAGKLFDKIKKEKIKVKSTGDLKKSIKNKPINFKSNLTRIE